MTAGEFTEVIREAFAEARGKERVETSSPSSRRYVYGIAGIARLFNCSITTANRIKQSGKIDEAISQLGRIITVDAELALQLMKKG